MKCVVFIGLATQMNLGVNEKFLPFTPGFSQE